MIYEIMLLCKTDLKKNSLLFEKIINCFKKKNISLDYKNHGKIKLACNIKGNSHAICISFFFKKKLEFLNLFKNCIIYNKEIIRQIFLVKKKKFLFRDLLI
ncbi:hypothetical protein [Candidatus Vidania fulgoroideorum]